MYGYRGVILRAEIVISFEVMDGRTDIVQFHS